MAAPTSENFLWDIYVNDVKIAERIQTADRFSVVEDWCCDKQQSVTASSVRFELVGTLL